jgi:hypothetical protein
MKRPGLLVGLVLLVGAVGGVIALKSREGNTQFVAQQQGLLPVSAATVQRLLLTTSDPRPGFGGRARQAHCESRSAAPMGNPWQCLVRYPREPRVRYRVLVHADRSIYGSGQPEGGSGGATLSVRGCCVGAL